MIWQMKYFQNFVWESKDVLNANFLIIQRKGLI